MEASIAQWCMLIWMSSFPAHAFPSDISTVYRPPQAVRAPPITKLACCDDLFAALSSNGEVFTFSLPTATDAEGSAPGVHTGGSRGQVKPQRAWALRRQFSSVRVRRLHMGLSSAGLNARFFVENNGVHAIRTSTLVATAL